MALFSGNKTVRVVGSDAFGPQMTLEEVQAAFVRGAENPALRALGQICMAMREDGVGDATVALSQDKPMEGAMHAGGANACAVLAQLITDLSGGRMGDEVKKWFKS